MSSRVALCPCGSGKRYKHCCAELLRRQHFAGDLGSLMSSALKAQIAGQHSDARDLYIRALEINASEPDCLHMLAVCYFRLGETGLALSRILRALELTGWKFDTYRHNLVLFLAKMARAGPVTSGGRVARDKYLEWSAAMQATRNNYVGWGRCTRRGQQDF